MHEPGCQHNDGQRLWRQPLCRVSDDAHAALLTISARGLARAYLVIPASEADTLTKLARDQV